MIDRLYEEVKDLDSDDPTGMEKIRHYLSTLNEEDDQYMELLMTKVGDREISWPRPWYQLSKSLTRKRIKLEDAKDGLELFKTDTINIEEAIYIDRRWRKFVKKFDVPDKPICLARWRNKSYNPKAPQEGVRYFVTAYVARGLQRTLYQVYKHFVTQYAAPVKRTYSPEEKKIVDICFQNDPRKAVTICAMVLSREPRSLYQKLDTCLNGEKVPRKKIKWTLPLANNFFKLLLKYTNLPLNDLKKRKIETEVWKNMENDMQEHYTILRLFWQRSLHVQLFVKEYVTIRRLRKKIYKKLLNTSYRVWSDIRWAEVERMFPDGYTRLFLYSVAVDGIRSYPDYLKVPLDIVLEYAFDKMKRKKRFHDKALKTLIVDKNYDLQPKMYE